MSFAYRQHVLAASNPVELVVALYDGIIRLLRQAADAADVDDVRSRRLAVQRALAIYMHLQSRLRPSVDVTVAANFSQFYAEMFRHTLLASSANSRQGFEQIIIQLSQVRDAWRIAARDSDAIQTVQRGTL